MASPLRIPDQAEELQSAKANVLAYVRQVGSPVAPADLYAAVRERFGVPVSVVQLAMWELISHKAIEFTKDYRVVVR